MNIVELQENDFSKAITELEKVLRSGGIAISPTDTVYGILGDAANEAAVSKMFALKNRLIEKAFPVFVRDIAMARRYAYVSDAKAKFLERVWPGPVTVVFHHKEKLPRVLTGGLGTIGLRIPDHAFLARVLQGFDTPIAQTSANISDWPPAQNIAQIRAYFEKSKTPPDLLIDGGELRGQSSTVIDLTGDNPIILRTGMVTKEELNRLLNIFS